ncbi:MAG: hypothetical protein PWP27_1579 [Clostridiales bacterium]|nr:hypothetical protein [Clostridiales bacterium]MDK2933769.1 hypothetical protein [Clostridiales bacterium]
MKVAILDSRKEAADAVANKIKDNGGQAIGVACDVLNKDSVIEAEKIVSETFGDYNILINGAGGNHLDGTTAKEILEIADLENKDENVVTFFDLETKGFEFVFNLNFIGTVIPADGGFMAYSGV